MYQKPLRAPPERNGCEASPEASSEASSEASPEASPEDSPREEVSNPFTIIVVPHRDLFVFMFSIITCVRCAEL